jgi:tetratricopeptide (TPR) repeat protein
MIEGEEPSESYLKGIEKLNENLKTNPKDAGSLFVRGNMYLTILENEKALADYTGALNISEDLYIFTNRGIAQARAGNFEAAVEDFTRAIELDENSEKYEIYYNRGLALLNKGEAEAAIDDFTVLLTHFKEDVADVDINRDLKFYARAYKLRAMAYRQIGENESAEEDEAEAKIIKSKIFN